MTIFKQKLITFLSKPIFSLNIVSLCALIVFLIGGYYLHYMPIKVSHSLVKTFLSTHATSTFPEIQANFQSILKHQTFGKPYARNLMLSLSTNSLKTGLFQREGGKEFITITAKEMEKEVEENPDNLKVLIRTIELFTYMAMLDPSFIGKAQFYIDKAQALNPGHPMLKSASSTIRALKGE